MKDKEKQIEEMYQDFLQHKHDTMCSVFSYRGMCENFINLGYRKITDSVVLSKEEYKILQMLYDEIFATHLILPDKAVENAKIMFADQKELIEKAYKIGSKETAEKILKWLKEHCDFVGFAIVETYFREQFGVQL